MAKILRRRGTPEEDWRLRIETMIRKILPAVLRRRLYQSGRMKPRSPVVGLIHWGDLARTEPFSTQFGYDRGGPVDRYYIERFLKKHADRITGWVMEVGDNGYTLRFGAGKVAHSDVLHIDHGAPSATIIGDLSDLPQVPGERFDCIILTQTLHLIYDYQAALRTCHRILKRGGALLLTTPGVSNIDWGRWGRTWYWSFTPASAERILGDVFGRDNVRVSAYGNVMAAAAFLYGLGVNEIGDSEKDIYDPHYPVIIAAEVTKGRST